MVCRYTLVNFRHTTIRSVQPSTNPKNTNLAKSTKKISNEQRTRSTQL